MFKTKLMLTKVTIILVIVMNTTEFAQSFFFITSAGGRCQAGINGVGAGYYGRIGGRFGNGFGGRFGGGFGGGLGGRLRAGVGRLPLGVREALLAINAYCDDTCATNQQQNQVIQCIQRAADTNSFITNVLRGCTPGPDISCNQNNRNQLNRCVIQRTLNRRNAVSIRLQRCFRQTLTIATIDCLINRYQILRTLLPLNPGPAGPVTPFFFSPARKRAYVKIRKNKSVNLSKKN